IYLDAVESAARLPVVRTLVAARPVSAPRGRGPAKVGVLLGVDLATDHGREVGRAPGARAIATEYRTALPILFVEKLRRRQNTIVLLHGVERKSDFSGRIKLLANKEMLGFLDKYLYPTLDVFCHIGIGLHDDRISGPNRF